ncbi:MAG TPA: TetR/AcrR family transcriptional regulator, partial [bacterium]|nr:TetR/AcrR family transcriptional regulator [bacterium]HOZ22623.1 TetR/AcrR family transcriptional regulator [bacterium]
MISSVFCPPAKSNSLSTSKEDLFLAICDQLVAEMAEIARRTLIESEGEGRQRLTAYAGTMIHYSRDNVKLITLVMHRIHQIDREKIKPYLARFSSVMRNIWHTISIPVRMEQEQQGGCAYDPLKLAILFDGLVRTYNMSRFGPLQSMPEEEIDQAANMITTIFFDGIGKPNKG